MNKEKDLNQKGDLDNERLWAVHIQGPDDIVAMISKKAADAYASEINTAYEAEALSRNGALPYMHAIVTPSPWLAAEHWRRCAQIQEEWISELMIRQNSQALEATARICLVPDEEAMARAWFQELHVPGLSRVPSDIHRYTLELLSKLPARPTPGDSVPSGRAMPSTEVMARAVQQAKAGLEPEDIRGVLGLLKQWGVIAQGDISATDLEHDEQCTQDYQAAQMTSAFVDASPIEIWRSGYAAAMRRCTF